MRPDLLLLEDLFLNILQETHKCILQSFKGEDYGGKASNKWQSTLTNSATLFKVIKFKLVKGISPIVNGISYKYVLS